jgi:hypothetical protein
MELLGEPEVVWVAVADDDSEQRWIAVSEAGNSREWQGRGKGRVKGPPQVKDEMLSRGLELYAGAPNLVRPAVDARAHAPTRPVGRWGALQSAPL